MLLAETPNLRITELTLDMAQSIHENSLDDETRKYLPDEVFETLFPRGFTSFHPGL